MLILAVTDHAEGHHVPGHPERPDRVTAALAGIRELDLGSSVRLALPAPAERRALRRVHSGDYLASLEVLSRSGGGALDPDTYVTPSSWEAALQSAGAGLAAMRELQRAGEGVGMVVSRPPGHHATRQMGMGFCLLNNVAIAAAELAEEGERVLVVDWDVHHGNGTQDIFWDDDRVLYASVHEHGIYPGTGQSTEIGGAGARGLNVNIPVPAGATGDVVRAALDEVVAPVVQEFEPTWVLVSAGFDAHRRGPLGRAGPLRCRLRRSGLGRGRVLAPSGKDAPVSRGWLRPHRAPRLRCGDRRPVGRGIGPRRHGPHVAEVPGLGLGRASPRSTPTRRELSFPAPGLLQAAVRGSRRRRRGRAGRGRSS